MLAVEVRGLDLIRTEQRCVCEGCRADRGSRIAKGNSRAQSTSSIAMLAIYREGGQDLSHESHPVVTHRFLGSSRISTTLSIPQRVMSGPTVRISANTYSPKGAGSRMNQGEKNGHGEK